MKTIMTLCVAFLLGGCADQPWQHPRQAAYSPPPRPNRAQEHERRFQQQLDQSIYDQELMDSSLFDTRK